MYKYPPVNQSGNILLRLWSVRLHLRREAFVKLKVFPNDKIFFDVVLVGSELVPFPNPPLVPQQAEQNKNKNTS